MDEQFLRTIASQLRKPHGELGLQIGEKMNQGNLIMNELTIKALNLDKHDSVLEIGMGNGLFVEHIVSAGPGIRYTGCDFSELMVKTATNLNRKFIDTGQASFHLNTADTLPFKSASFDKLFTVNTTYFWEDTQAVLTEFHRVLKPDGQLLVAIRPKSVMEKYPFTRYGFTLYSGSDLTNLLTSNNFKVINIIEKDEPDTEIDGQFFEVKSVIVSAGKT